MEQRRNGAACKARRCRVRTAGEDRRHAGAEHDTGQLRAAKIYKLLDQHVAALEIGNHEDVGLAGDGRDQLFDCSGFLADGSIEGERAIENAASDLAAVGHLAKRGGVEGGLDLGIDGFNRGEQRDLGLGNAKRVGQVDGVLHDMDLVFERRVQC